MTLDEIKLMWKEDCIVDDIELDKSSLDVPKLHAKYSELLSDTLVKLKQKQFQYNLLIKDKWLWFNGKLDKETIDKQIANLNTVTNPPAKLDSVPKAKPKVTSAALTAAEKEAERLRQRVAALEAEKAKQQQTISYDTQIPLININQTGADGRKG